MEKPLTRIHLPGIFFAFNLTLQWQSSFDRLISSIQPPATFDCFWWDVSAAFYAYHGIDEA